MTQTQRSPGATIGGYVGARARKRRGDVFLTGHARYVNDIVLPGTSYAAVLRSPHAHARIVSVDSSRAAERPGVLTAIDGTTAAAASDPIPPNVDPVLFGAPAVPLRCLAVDKVHFYGQPVAAVVAETQHEAEAALADINVRYDVLEPLIEAEEAMRPDAPILYDGWTSNVLLHMPINHGDVDAALAAADAVISDEIRIQRYTSAPMETRGCIADWNPYEKTLTYYGASQNPHPLRWTIARALRLAESQVRVVAPDIGGAFGLKIYSLPEDTLIPLLSMLTARPVKWIEDRRDSLVIGGREQLHRFTVGFKNDGKITALRDHLIGNVGALSPAPGWPTPFITGLTLPSGYKIPNTEVTVDIVVTNKGQSQAVRGVGKEATALVMERIVDLVARHLKFDPAEVRRSNFIAKDEFPYRTNSGLNIDSGDYHRELDRLLELVDYREFPAEQERLQAVGRYRGLGLGFELTPESAGLPATVMTGHDTTTVRVDPSGSVTVLTGVTTPGGGNDTAIAQIVADEIGVSLEDVRLIQGDTGVCPYGLGNAAGRSAMTGGGSAALAARDVRALLTRAASALMAIPADDLEIREGQVTSGGTAMTVREVVYAIYTGGFGLPPDIAPPLECTRSYRPDNIELIPDAQGRINPYPAYSNAAHASIVEVDIETGAVTLVRHVVVHDCGNMLNPALVEGQMRGATVMGIGAALMESLQYDDNGRLLSDQFKTYLLPRATDVPNIEIEHQVTPSPFSLLGTKGAGEAGVGGAQAAIANAVENALAPFGVTVRQVPLTPPTVLAMIAEAVGQIR